MYQATIYKNTLPGVAEAIDSYQITPGDTLRLNLKGIDSNYANKVATFSAKKGLSTSDLSTVINSLPVFSDTTNLTKTLPSTITNNQVTIDLEPQQTAALDLNSTYLVEIQFALGSGNDEIESWQFYLKTGQDIVSGVTAASVEETLLIGSDIRLRRSEPKKLYLDDGAGSSVDFVIDGRVGIGDSTPNAKLHVATGDVSSDPLVYFFVTNPAYNDNGVYIDYVGLYHGLTAYNKNTNVANSSAGNFVSDNVAFTTLQVSGKEESHGTIKATHTKPAGLDDSGAAVLSLSVRDNGAERTTAKGVYINAPHVDGSQGPLFHATKGSTVAGNLADVLKIDYPDGKITINGQYSLPTVAGEANTVPVSNGSGEISWVYALNQNLQTNNHVQFGKIGVGKVPGVQSLEVQGGAKFTENLFLAAGISNSSSLTYGQVGTLTSGIEITRERGDGETVLKVINKHSSSTGDLVQFQNTSGTVAKVRLNGTIQPANLNDSLAEEDSIYYSTNLQKLSYKDVNGVVHPLY